MRFIKSLTLQNCLAVRRWMSRKLLLRAMVSLFAVAQLMPAGASVAQEGDGFELVMCTPNGLKTLTWEEATGEPSPFDAPQDDDGHRAVACHAVTNDPRGQILKRN